MQGGCDARPTRFAGVDSIVLPYSPSPDWKNVYIPTSGSIRFRTTSVADINQDQVVNLDRFFSFYTGCASTSGTADLNGDGKVDLLEFFLCFKLFDAV